MGIRFPRRLRVLPGLWLNLSKSGGSVSLGGRGATLNLSKRGKMVTTSRRGSGLSYPSSELWVHGTSVELPAPSGKLVAGMMVAAIVALAAVAAVILAAQ